MAAFTAAAIGIAAIGTVAAGAMSASAAKSAAKTQAGAAMSAAQLQYQASQDALQQQQQQYQQSRQDLAPWRAEGQQALSQMHQLTYGGPSVGDVVPSGPFAGMQVATTGANMTLSGTPGGAGIGANMAPGSGARVGGNMAPGAGPGVSGVGLYPAQAQQVNAQFPTGTPYFHDFGMADFEQDPGYQFRLSEGMKAIQASAAAKGGLLSGRTLKDIGRFSQNTASDEFLQAYNRFNLNRQNTFNRYASLAGIGQQASTTTAQLGQNAATQAGQDLVAGGQAQASGQIGAANARASGYVGQANAFGQGMTNLGSIGQSYLNYQQNQQQNALLQQYLQQQQLQTGAASGSQPILLG